MDTFSKIIPTEVLDAYGIAVESVEPALSGLINETWFVTARDQQRYVVQRLHPAISANVNSKIQFVTQILANQNVTTPRLITTSIGATYFETEKARWRVLSYVEGRSFDVISDVDQAFEAGSLLAKFHGALEGVGDLEILRSATVHDLGRHIAKLERALVEQSNHVKITEITKVAHEILSSARALPQVHLGPPQVVHGDPKISNFLFDESGRCVCMVDLDTVALMPLAWELGDAFRSWCNPFGEDSADTEFCLKIFRAGLQGYASALQTPFRERDIDNIVPAIQTIYTELAARFCADALYENYFAWDPDNFPTRADHNITRARGQLRAALDLDKHRCEALAIVREVFASPIRR